LVFWRELAGEWRGGRLDAGWAKAVVQMAAWTPSRSSTFANRLTAVHRPGTCGNPVGFSPAFAA
jgi:hypothetical protein